MTQPAPKRPTRHRRHARKLPRTTILFFLGIGLMINEAGPWNHDGASTAILVTGLVLVGFPISEAADLFRGAMIESWQRRPEQEDPPEEGPP